MMPTMPTFVALPSEYRNAYRVAPVVAAIPMGHPDMYVVTAVNPQSPLAAPTFVAAEVQRGAHGSWFADEAFPSGTLAEAIGDMASLAGGEYPRLL
jgi:hypothetical protein